MAKTYLTDAFVRDFKCPAGKPVEFVWDHPVTLDGRVRNGAQPGLGLSVTAKGSKAFVHSYLLNGKRTRKVLGPTAKMTVGSARLMVQMREAQIDEGNDPDAERINFRQKHTITVREVIDRYFEERMHSRGQKHRDEFFRLIAPWARPLPLNPHRGRRRAGLKAFGDLYGDTPAANVTPQHVSRYLGQIENDHRYNGALRQIKTLFNWAIRMQLVDMRNPASPFEVRRTLKQRRDYSQEEVRAIARHIFHPCYEAVPVLPDGSGRVRQCAGLEIARKKQYNDMHAELCRYMGILFLTMARPLEVRSAEFAHFDLNRLIWHKHHTKGILLSRARHEYAYRSVPIHPKVAELVERQRLRWPDSRFVFPNRTDLSRPRDNFQKGICRFRELPDVPDHFQLYDLKRIAISLMLTGQGVPREAVSHYVDHKGNLETTMIYDLGFVDPMRPVTERLGELLGV
ncbi:tyrosine-type recombinase/integrase [Salaquimonas pukyongi]|uniref:tyrosine-type recombinase/integrase n=1 Tax=Salaquimonas pukyongi TaxID=2712698 RepID=UPI0009F97F77|nr:integrase family protein [Salaquimonas pukyongi]